MYYVYVLENNKGKHYIGSCEDIERRLKRHNQNSVRSTKNKGPWKIIYQQECSSRTEARVRESRIKQYKDVDYFLRLNNNMSPSSSLV